MTQSVAIDDVLSRLGNLSPEARKATENLAVEQTKHMAGVPNPGPQTTAYFAKADQLFFGGSVAGGKSDLALGAALNLHQQSLILRRVAKEATILIDRMKVILGTDAGYNGQDKIWRRGKQTIQFGGAANNGDEAGYKGKRRDLVALDEASEFLEEQADFLWGWVGSPDMDQHCQLLLTSNPPRTMAGRWLLRWFGPWLDRTHARYPTEDGKLVWCMPILGTEPVTFEWRDKPWTEERDGKRVRAISRTFIRSELQDNPDFARTGYGERIGNLSDMNRRMYALGDFTAGLEDHPDQLIPTEWVLAAQGRWRPDGGKAEPMTAIGLDPAGGGKDDAVVAPRHGGWYAELVIANGPETADGSATVAMVTRYRRNGAPVVVDVGGGYGGGAILRMKDNEIPYIAFNGAHASFRRTRDKQLKFANKKAEAWWIFREELDPDQEGGSVIALPPDPELLADLTAIRYEVRAKGIQLEPKDDVRERLGRSPGRGDAVIMAMSEGNRAARRMVARDYYSDEEQARGEFGRDFGKRVPKVIHSRPGVRSLVMRRS